MLARMSPIFAAQLGVSPMRIFTHARPEMPRRAGGGQPAEIGNNAKAINFGIIYGIAPLASPAILGIER